MASKEFSQKLKELRIRAGYTQKHVYEHFNIPQSTFSSWEVGKSEPSGEMLIKLCDYYNCDMVKEFKSSTDDMVTYNELKLIEKYRDLDPHGKEMVNLVLNKELERSTAEKETIQTPPTRIINYYYRLASAGTGQILFDMPPTKRIEIPDISDYKRVDYAIGVNGDSMTPTYNDGDMLLVEMTDEIEIGQIGIFLVNGECFVKELGNKELISLNPNYKNIPINETTRCMGRVIDKL